MTIKTLNIPPKGRKQIQPTIPTHIVDEMVAAGACKIAFKRCGLHLSIDPVFEDLEEKEEA